MYSKQGTAKPFAKYANVGADERRTHEADVRT